MLTEKGREFQNRVIPVIENAELSAFASLSDSEQETIADLWETYITHCIEKMKGGIYDE